MTYLLNIEPTLTRNVWYQLSTGQVPIASSKDMLGAFSWAQQVTDQIRSHSYVPDVVFGYMGIEKQHGVTRFIPILTKEDLAVYYHLCGELGSRTIVSRDNIFGGWRAIPRTLKNLLDLRSQNKISEEEFWGEYSSLGGFSNAAWFDAFKDYNAAQKQALIGTRFVIKTDIANFYDSIDIGRLTRKLRRAVPDLDGHVDLLEVFLSYWNRRTTGYQQSTRGIPQEIISDGSRNLSHFYLQDFDEKMISYCQSRSIHYIRWHDDLIFTGVSGKALENAIYQASQFLLIDGLNLNAAKTKIYNKTDFSYSKGFAILEAIERRDVRKFRNELRKIQGDEGKRDLRLETIFRASLGFVARMRDTAGPLERSFIQETLRTHPEYIGGLGPKHMVNLLKVSHQPAQEFERLVRKIVSRNVSGPRATLLQLLRRSSSDLIRLGVKKSALAAALESIRTQGQKSEIIDRFCLPRAAEAVERIPD